MVVLVRGIGDVGSAVAHRLFRARYAVVIHDRPQPTWTRRRMAFADAVFDGTATLEGVTAVRLDDLDALSQFLGTRAAIPVSVTDLPALLRVAQPDVLVDARMRKRTRPEVQRGLARLTIGLGPNFVANETTDLVVETSWGADLGKVIRDGVVVSARTKVIEVDPRGPTAIVMGIDERPARIAVGVLRAVQAWAKTVHARPESGVMPQSEV